MGESNGCFPERPCQCWACERCAFWLLRERVRHYARKLAGCGCVYQGVIRDDVWATALRHLNRREACWLWVRTGEGRLLFSTVRRYGLTHMTGQVAALCVARVAGQVAIDEVREKGERMFSSCREWSFMGRQFPRDEVEPVVMMPFGKFSGKPLGEIPDWYLSWVVGLKIKKQLRLAIGSELARRVADQVTEHAKEKPR